MSRPPLHIVTEADTQPAPTEGVAARVRRLQAAAQQLARDHVKTLLAKLSEAEAIAAEIASGGPVYHDGAQERARQIAKEIESQRITLGQIVGRS